MDIELGNGVHWRGARATARAVFERLSELQQLPTVIQGKVSAEEREVAEAHGGWDLSSWNVEELRWVLKCVRDLSDAGEDYVSQWAEPWKSAFAPQLAELGQQLAERMAQMQSGE